MAVRNYQAGDYEAVKALYLRPELFGGQFDPARDAPEKMKSVLVFEEQGKIKGTVSLVDDGRVAWLFRFAVEKCETEKKIAKALYDAACEIFKANGHTQVLVYTPAGDAALAARYAELGMNKGGDYTCFWAPV